MAKSIKSIAIAEEAIISKINLQTVRRNERRFPDDFMFQLTAEELNDWKSQIVISNREKLGLRKPPLAFTEQGVAMLSSVLNSQTAIEVNIQIIRIFTRMREMLLTHKDILVKLEQVEKQLLQQDARMNKHEEDIQMIFEALKELLNPPIEPRPRIGFRRQDEEE
ncbi:MAG TPA: ORF6N domain-containing protein [Puia sp.]|nr:ORF6N domain-containing protein [Puia sp.]